ncbi:hypothetical protein [Brevundimonas sp.]|uniref:hypothetical protein n=1 Tax=Brevundimonas sp. TaxID=1871086 RepID=UPI0035B4AF09
MPTDPNRSTFVQQEYRYETVQNLTVKATYPSARELVHTTNLNEAAAAALATAIFNESGVPADAYKVTVEGAYKLEDIAGAPLRFALNLPSYVTDGRTFKVTSFEVDHLNSRTTFEVRG